MIGRVKNRVESARICLNAVYVKPYRALKAEEYMIGKKIDEAHAEKAGEAVVADAKPLGDNDYMVQIAKVLIKRAIMGCK